MSAQWEVVGKSKKVKNYEKKTSIQTERNRIIESGPKLEEILPSHQVKSLFSNLNKDKKKDNKTVNNLQKISPKKVPKPASDNQNKKPVHQQSIKPKNLNAALLTLSPTDLETLIETLKISFPESQLVWLKGILSFLNSNLHYEIDPVIAGKSLQYPTSAVPQNLYSVIVKNLQSVDDANRSYFFDQLLTGLAMDMSKGQTVVGYMILLQIIATKWPQYCSNNLAKNAILRNSYQNRSSIGLSLLWALGQGGFVDLMIGLKVWQNIMMPLLEMKNYTRFICEYIERILKISKNNVQILLTQVEFFDMYKTLTCNSGLPKDCQKMLNESAMLLMKKYIQSSVKLSNVFLNLFRNIESVSQSALELTGSIDCLVKSEECFKIWKMNYKNNLLSSLLLITQILEEEDSLPISFIKSEALKEFLNEITKINEELMNGKKKDPNLKNIIETIKILQDKSLKKKNPSKKSSSACPWVCGSILLLIAIGGFISYDVHIHGGIFEKSSTGKFLKNTGALPYVEIAWFKTMSCSARGYKWAENNLPIYYEKASVIAKPYINLSCDLYKITRNAFANIWENLTGLIESKTPVVTNFIEQYAPGLPQKIQDFSKGVCTYVSNTSSNVVYVFKTKVFIGTLSPENLSKAFNQTQVAAAKYYSWFHEKIDAYAKIK